MKVRVHKSNGTPGTYTLEVLDLPGNGDPWHAGGKHRRANYQGEEARGGELIARFHSAFYAEEFAQEFNLEVVE